MSILHQTPRSLHSRTWSSNSSQCLTPSRSGEKSVKGILLTSKRNYDKNLDATIDRTTTPVSPQKLNSSQKLTLYHQFPGKQLFRKDSPFPKKYKDLRNKSLPAIHFDYQSYSGLSGFKTIVQPYERLFDNSTAQKNNSHELSQKYSPFSDVSTSKDTVNQKNPVNLKSTVTQCLKFDLSSSNKKGVRNSPEISKGSPISSQKFTQVKISQIYVAQTPKKLNSSRKQGSTLKNLKNKIITNSIEESLQKKNVESLRERRIMKNEFESSLNIDQLRSKMQVQPQILKNIEITEETFNERLKIFEQLKKNQQIIDFFALSPKISQQFEGSIYELTDSGKKGLHFSPNWKLAESRSIDLSLIKPVKRKLTLGQSDKQWDYLKESLILTELLNSLKKNVVKQKKPFHLKLARKCSPNLCLVQNKQSGILCGLVRTQINEKFIYSETQFEGQKLCLQKFADFENFIFMEPFEYTLQEIFQMKLIEEKDISGLIRKFHPILNEIMQKGRGKINVHMLKERIVYTHGSFKLIPLVGGF